ncbi:NADP-dependent malic enzyme [Peredibacter sp. HCB2-198]|uniref:NADP-dependent malic enzyme n=1 Tax=Peredibacter sp. HCB2-198 TaxID=3383025 RepID=UPI0038B66D27
MTTPTNETTSAEEKYRLALDYHAHGRAGKVEITPTKPTMTARDLSLAYSPGVAAPCLEIAKTPDDVYKYTAKGNLVAVLSNGTAVLGLGDIGPLAGKPVMEGKGVLFKRFADIDVFDIEINNRSVEDIVRTVKSLEPTFGGINLEDIKAPECFEVETQLQEIMDIPIFHDDQHGTAIIGGAAFLNACEITNRDISKVRVVVSGAGAAAIATANFLLELGVKRENVLMADSKGVIYKGRTDGMNKYKDAFANETKCRTLADALVNADALIGCSAKGLVSKEMVKTMAKDPIIFAMANPDPEITPEEVAQVRSDAIMATGRSDYANQVNNVLCFPFLFRGALDVRARKINEEMKKAAAMALAKLAKEEVPEDVKRAYGNENFSFGRNYLIPKPFDKRVLTWVAPAVAKAAMDSGVARMPIEDLNAYAKSLQERLGQVGSIMRNIRSRLPGAGKAEKPRIVFPEGTNARILKAVSILRDEGLIQPILLGNKKIIHRKMDELGVSNLKDLEIIYPEDNANYETFVKDYFTQRQRKGVSYSFAKDTMKRGNYFGSMMVKTGNADGMITGATQNYPECIRPIMKVIGTNSPGRAKVAGIMMLVFKQRVVFLADCTVQMNPDAHDLADIALSAAQMYRNVMQAEPRVAFLSYSNFGSNRDPQAAKMAEAVKIAKAKDPTLIADGEMQADVAVNADIMKNLFEFCSLDKAADVLIFPDLGSANISYKLLAQLGGATSIGPILLPLKYAINIVQRTSTVDEIVNMSHLTALISQEIKAHRAQKHS